VSREFQGPFENRDLLLLFPPQLDSMVVSRGPECKRTRRGGRKKKLLTAPVSRYLLLPSPFFNI
jgi:hypothetical protein